MQRALATRLEKLERRYKPADGIFFLVWGSDRAGVDKALAAACEADKIAAGDIVIAEVWPTELEPRPATRWILHRAIGSQLSPDEQHILCNIAQEKVQAGSTKTDMAVVMSVCRGPKHARTDYSNEELVGICLGRRFGVAHA
jgi:hypothetical protein